MRISFIGSGNVATHLASELFKVGHSIAQIFSKNFTNADALAKQVNAKAIQSINALDETIDILIIAISDRAIESIAFELTSLSCLVVHTSGSIPIQVLSKLANHGVFYPLQTFSKDYSVNFSLIPLCLEANNAENLSLLENIAKSISPNIYKLDSEQRKQCHLAAVFANNFTNHFYTIAAEILAEKQIPFDILKPLILETAQKIETLDPKEAQTGLARRNDLAVMQKHMSQLKSDKLEKLYSFVSDSIVDFYNKK